MQIPEVGGGIIALDPNTGRVLAVVGGFSFAMSQFDRAIQAQAPARLLVQAVRLRRGHRQRLQADLDRARRADRDRAGAGPGHLEARELREGAFRRPLDAALRRREVAQPDDGAARPGHRHAAHHRIRTPLRRLRRPAAGALHVARRRRDDAFAHGDGLLHDRQRRASQVRADPHRPHPGPLGQVRLAPRQTRRARAARPTPGPGRRSPRSPTTASRSSIRTPPTR